MAVAISVALSIAFGWNPVVSIALIVSLQITARFIPMPAGLSFFNFTDLTWEGPTENMGGFGSVAYFAAWEDIATWPTLMSSPTNDTQLVTLLGHFVMKADKYFIKVYVTPETADFKASNQGETDGQSFRNEGEYFYPGSAVATRALARKLNNSRGVLILVDPDGERVCVGTEAFPAFFKPSLAFGKAAADRKGLTVTFYQNHFVPGLIYNGPIPLSGSLVPAIS
jgi:hypothetical protein